MQTLYIVPPRSNLTERQPFVVYFGSKDNSYHSMVDTTVQVNGKTIPTAKMIAYDVSQNNLPLFGFNSYVFDDMARGNRIVQGQIVVNYTTPGYLFDILNSSSDEVNNQNRRALWYKGVDISIIIGKEKRTVIKNVTFGNIQKQIDDSGRVIEEVYSFIGRDIEE